MAFTISYVYQATDQFTPTIRRISFFIERLNRRLRITGQLFTQMQGGMGAVNASMLQMRNALQQSESSLQATMHAAREYERQLETLTDALNAANAAAAAGGGAGGGPGPGPGGAGPGGAASSGWRRALAGGLALSGLTSVAGRFVGGVFNAAASVDAVEKSLGRMLRSGEKTGQLMAFLKDRAKNTIFSVPELGNLAKKLIATGTSFGDLESSLRTVMDVSAGAGQDIGGVGLAFAQVKAKGRLMGEEVLQFADRGISIVPILADLWGDTIEQVIDSISKGEVGFNKFDEALTQLTDKKSKWGMFANASEEATKQLDGAFKQLNASVKAAGGALGLFINEAFGLSGTMLYLAAVIYDVIESFNGFSDAHPFITKTTILFGSMLVIVAILAAGIAALIGLIAIVGAPLIAAVFIIAGIFTLLITLLTDFQLETESFLLFLLEKLMWVIEAVGSVFGGGFEITESIRTRREELKQELIQRRQEEEDRKSREAREARGATERINVTLNAGDTNAIGATVDDTTFGEFTLGHFLGDL